MSPRSQSARAHRFSSLGFRLTASSLVVALASIILLAGATLVLTDIDLTNAGQENESTSVAAVVSAVRATYQRDHDGDWKPRDLAPVQDLVRTIGVGVQITVHGRSYLTVALPGASGPTKTVTIRSGNLVIATGTFRFPHQGLLPEEVAFQRSFETSVLLASLLALGVALAASVLGTRRLVRPVHALREATSQLADGDLSSRVGPLSTTRELGELAASFDSMAEQLQHADVLRRTMVADLTHELRTPLSVLHAQLEDLASGTSPLNAHAVESLSEEVTQITRLMDDLRILSSADAAVLTLREVSLDLAIVSSNAASRLALAFQQRGIHLNVSLSPAYVKGDPHRLEQVVVNLLSNAAKFTDAGGVVEVKVGRDGSNARLIVTDTGRGMSPEDQASVFARFVRGGNSAGTSGTGIGLAVVQALVTSHGGRVSVTSSPGVGSTFLVELPLDGAAYGEGSGITRRRS